MSRDAGGSAQLVERDAELRRVGSALERASAGSGSLFVVEGPAGIGKSRLLAEAGALADAIGLDVLRARGGVMERDLAYGAVRLLLERPLAALDAAERAEVCGGAAALAAPALAAVGAEGRAPPDRGFAVEHGLFWCVANLAERQPLLLALDDAHWFDAPSLRFFAYLARRVADLPVAMIVATRPDERGPDQLVVQQLSVEPDAGVMRPAPLSADGVTAVLSERWGESVAPEFGVACHRAVGGNPFLLSELAGALVAGGVRPTAQAVACVRGVRTPGLSRTIRLRLERMPAGATALATAVAILGDGASLELAGALAGQDEVAAAAALDRLAAAEILLPALPLQFVHPIVREAVYGGLGPAQCASLHARAAGLLREREGSLEVAASHLLVTAPNGRADTVEALRRAARCALDRGAPDIAARYLKRALAEPPPSAVRPLALLELGGAGFLAGESVDDATARLREAIGLIGDPAVRAEAWLLLSRVMFVDGGVPGGVAVLEEALQDVGAVDDVLRRRLETELGGSGMTHPETAVRAAARIDALTVPEGRTAAERLTLCNLVARSCFTGRSAVATTQLAERALAGGQLGRDEAADSNPVYQVAYALVLADRLGSASRLLELAVAEGHARGSIWSIATTIGCRAFVRYLTGDLAESVADARYSLQAGPQPLAIPMVSAFLCLALVECGELDDPESVIQASGCGPQLPEVMHMNQVFWARGRLRAAQGRYADALDDMLEFGRRSDRVELLNPTLSWRADAALVHARLGDRAAATKLAGAYHELASDWGTERVLGISARTRGLLAGGDRGLALLGEAVEAHAASPARLELGHSELALGAALRRAGRRADAIGPLRRAWDLAARCGATALAARVAEELRVAGAAGQRRAFSGATSLTPSELRVARMAAEGLSNRDIAENLFVTAKTVENHLGRCYVKLGIGSRVELADALRGVPGVR